MTTDTIPTTGQQAQLCYDALATAVAVTEQRMALKSAEPFRNALALQISSYKAEMMRLATAFPELS
jgi:hypothetical protein